MEWWPLTVKYIVRLSITGARCKKKVMLQDQQFSEFLQNYKRKLLPLLILAVVVFAALLLYGDINKIRAAFFGFRWTLIPVILALTFLDDTLRFLKWDYFLETIGIEITTKESASIFFGGLAMTITPGKVGEFFKSYLIKKSTGERMSTTMPVIVIERVTDLIAVSILASIGVAYFQYGLLPLAIIITLVVVFIGVVQNQRISLFLLEKLKMIPKLGEYHKSARRFYKSSYELFKASRLLPAIVLSVFAWGSECMAMFLVFKGLEIETGLLMPIFIFSFSSIMGVVSMLPGGLGVTEASMTGIIILLTEISEQVAVTATLIIRFSTLWFGFLLGISALIYYQKKYN